MFSDLDVPPRLNRALCFFRQDHKEQTRVYILVSGQPDVWLWRKRDFLTEEDVYSHWALEPREVILKSKIWKI